ncbi:MAG: Rrf2 family transcriptional regulator [Peptococcaceae bacterium]|nr:Rrf2 family transcriptional regulator [Peptococcaceae bacterium]
MTLNQATDYALRAVLFLAKQPQGEVSEAQIIAHQEIVPMRFLLKIMPSLIKAGIVKSFRGVGGGYTLAKPPGEITFLDVVEAVEGPIAINKCLTDYAYCTKHGAPACEIHSALADVQAKLRGELRALNFQDLIR